MSETEKDIRMEQVAIGIFIGYFIGYFIGAAVAYVSMLIPIGG